MIERILVPIDFSSDSINAMEFAIEIAKKTKARLRLIYVKSKKNFDVPFFFQDIEVEKVSIESFFEIIERKYFSDIDFNYDYKIREGKVFREVVNQAKYDDTELIIMGTHGLSGFEMYWIGSNAFKIVTNATCPVITIRNGFLSRKIKNIVMPIDVTKASRKKLAFTTKLAQICYSTIHLVSVRETNRPAIIKKLQNYIEQSQEYIKNKNVDVIVDNLYGKNITDITIEYAKQINADLISIMTEQPENAYNIFLGKYAQQMVNNSPIPVLSIRPKY